MSGRAIEITYDVRGARAPTRDDARQQHRAHVTERRVVVLALVNHEAVVALGERGVSLTCPVRRAKERFSQWRVTRFRWSAVTTVQTRGTQ